MSDEQITEVIKYIDEALRVFQNLEGVHLTGKQLSVKSMLMALRSQMVMEQRRVREEAD